MTEAEWLSCDDPAAMLGWLLGGTQDGPYGAEYGRSQCASDRKLRLWVCACVRAHDGPLGPREAVTVPGVERLADAGASPADYAALDPLLLGTGEEWARRWAARELRQTPDLRAFLLREVFGNPFRPAPSEPCTECAGGVVPTDRDDDTCPCCRGTGRRFPRRWVTATALGIARRAYDGRDFAALPVLRDALLDAGCEDEQILAHLLEPTHARGCWVLDLLLVKS